MKWHCQSSNVQGDENTSAWELSFPRKGCYGRVRKNCVLISNILIYSNSLIYLYTGIIVCQSKKDIRDNPVIEINFIDVITESDKPHEQPKVIQLVRGREKKNPGFLNWGRNSGQFSLQHKAFLIQLWSDSCNE